MYIKLVCLRIEKIIITVLLPGVHPTVHDRVVHRIGHCQPVKGQIYVLYVRCVS